jgi:hypothetical protein
VEAINEDDDFRRAADPLLNLIDESLALDGTAVSDRTPLAARRLVTDFIPEVRIGDEPPCAPGTLLEFSSAPWFKVVYKYVEDWYQARYGRRIAERGSRVTRGIIVIASTPFEIHVPIAASRVETEGETAWLSIPNRVLETEDALTWVQGAPNWATYPDDVRQPATANVLEVANLIRRISCRLTGADVSDPVARNLLAGIRVHLQSACDLIMREGEEGSYARAQWELQMACESAYKGYSQQVSGKFSETHDLFVLHDRSALPEASVRRDLVRSLPRWHEAANLRYGLGAHPTIVGIAHWYRTALTIIAGVVDNLAGIDLSEASLLLQMAPWLRGRQPDA